MLNPPLTAADVGGLFETTDGKRAFVTRWEEDDDKEFMAYIIGEGIYAFSDDGRGYRDFHLARRLPTSDPITERERAVVEAAVAWRRAIDTPKYAPEVDTLIAATTALISARQPCPRRVDSPEALRDVLLAAGWAYARAVEVGEDMFNALPEAGE